MFCPECGTKNEEGAKFCAGCGESLVLATASNIRSQKPKKPMGLILIIFYSGFWGIVGMILGGVMLLGTSLSILVGILGIIIFGLSILELVAAYGVWSLVEWGRNLAVIIYGISIPLSIFSLFIGDVTPGMVFLTIISIAVAVIILIYLVRPDVKRLFQ